MFPNLVTYHIYRPTPSGDPPPASPAMNAGQPPAYQYILAGNGLFVRAESRFWQACIPLAPCPVRGLPPLSTQFALKGNRLPGSVLCEVIRHAQQRRDADGRLVESLYRICPRPDRTRIIWPAQTATAYSVTTTSDRPTGTLLELHSHGRLPAAWSPTDDRDEQGGCLYGVIGRLDGVPEIRLRLGIYGYWLPLALADLFDLDSSLPFPIRDLAERQAAATQLTKTQLPRRNPDEAAS